MQFFERRLAPSSPGRTFLGLEAVRVLEHGIRIGSRCVHQTAHCTCPATMLVIFISRLNALFHVGTAVHWLLLLRHINESVLSSASQVSFIFEVRHLTITLETTIASRSSRTAVFVSWEKNLSRVLAFVCFCVRPHEAEKVSFQHLRKQGQSTIKAAQSN